MYEPDEGIKKLADHDLLTKKEELELGRIIQEATRLLEEAPDSDTEAELNERRQEAINTLVRHNQRLIVPIAARYTMRGNLDFGDLVQQGTLGLIQAAQKYDPERGWRFSTYATHWVRQSISRALPEQGLTIRIPVHRHDQLTKMWKVIEEMTSEMTREPTDEEIAEEMDESVRIVKALRAIQQPDSLDRPVGDDADTDFAYWISDDNATCPEQNAEQSETARIIEDVLNTLPPREARILRLRFGLNGDARIYTLQEVGKKFGLTRERIRQIEMEALQRLRHPSRARVLKGLIG